MSHTQVPPLLRVAMLDDHPIVVAGLAHVMAQHPTRIRVVHVDSQRPVLDDVDIVLCDTFAAAPGGGRRLARLVGTQAKVVLFAGDLAASSIDAALRAGVAAYVSKRLSTEELVLALEAVHRGEVVALPVPGSGDVPGPGSWPGREHGLSSREAEILAMIARGHSNDEIARELFLSINSIKTYVRTAYRKIEVTRRAQAVRWAFDHGFLADSPEPPTGGPARTAGV